MKHIIIVNGSGGVGKDTFVDALEKCGADVTHMSIVGQIKKVASFLGWDGSKGEKDRKFLSDLLDLSDWYNDRPYTYFERNAREFLGSIDTGKPQLLCVDMRQKKHISRAVKEFGAKTVLVTRSSVPHITSNHADSEVFDMEYDYLIENEGSISDLKRQAAKFINQLEKQAV